MNTRRILTSLITFTILTVPLAAQTAPRAPEIQKLEAFVGTWTTEGKVEASPMGPAGTWKGTLKGEWAPGGFAVIRYDDQKDGSGAAQRAILIFHFDAKTKTQRAFMVGSDGTSDTGKLSFGADSMTWDWELSAVKGKRITLRGTLKPLSGEVREYEEAYSEDGKTWKIYSRARDTRKK